MGRRAVCEEPLWLLCPMWGQCVFERVWEDIGLALQLTHGTARTPSYPHPSLWGCPEGTVGWGQGPGWI